MFLAALSAFAQTPYTCTTNMSWSTSQLNNQRTGANTSETCLTPSNVSASGNMAEQVQLVAAPHPLGCATSASGTAANATYCCPSLTNLNPVYSQPLYDSTSGLVIITTLNDQVFAYSPTPTAPTAPNPCNAGVAWGLWQWERTLTVATSTYVGDCNLNSQAGTINNPASALPFAGIVSTPVINSGVLYVVGGCEDKSNSSIHWYLHGLSLTDGSDTFTAIDIGGDGTSGGTADQVYVPAYGTTGNYPAGVTNCGTGTNNCIKFQAALQVQRSALLYLSGKIYIGFAVNNVSETSYSNQYHGWLIGYNPSTSSTANFAFASAPNIDNTTGATPACSGASSPYTNECGLGGGIWMSGRAPAVYTYNSNTYVVVGAGNGGFQTGGSYPSYGNSIIAFNANTTCNTQGTAPTLCTPDSFFAARCYPAASCPPSGNATVQIMNAWDQDNGASGPLVTDSSAGTAVVAVSKAGTGFVLPQSGLPGYSSGSQPDCTSCEFAGSLTSPLSSSFTSACNGFGNTPTPICDSVSSLVYWQGNLWIWPYGEDVDWCAWSSTTFSCDPTSGIEDDGIYTPSGFPGGSMTMSLNQADPNGHPLYDTAILWAIVSPGTAKAYQQPDASPNDYKGIIKAYWPKSGPGTVTGPPNFDMPILWYTSTSLFHTSIFALPTVVNGRVYVPTYDQGVLEFFPNYQ